ncbi:ATP-dependent translocase ABCB1-like [Tubulanus polymorphus]|uniref:ATP-dependent translocase ABCB1-like n=1 Tax=Tubulanus polymorphus TaxID=672921 RepID=UPI003DA685B0
MVRENDERAALLPGDNPRNEERENINGSFNKYGSTDVDSTAAEQKQTEPPDVSFMGTDKKKTVSFFQMFRFATKLDVLLIIVGSLASIAHGAAWPVLFLNFGEMTDSFIPVGINVTNGTGPNFVDAMNDSALVYLYIACGTFAAAFIQVTCWSIACERQTHAIRQEFFKSILRQEIGWFDTHKSGELSTRLADDLERVREGLGDKSSLVVQSLSMFVSGFVVGFIKSWKLTLVMMSLSPLLAICSAFLGKLIQSYSNKEQQSYAKAGSVAEEVLSCIKTVTSFNGHQKELKRYNSALRESYKIGNRKTIVSSVGIAFFFLVIFSTYSLSFWYGSTQVQQWQECLTTCGISPGEVLTVFFCVMIASQSMGMITPHITAVATAMGSAVTIFGIIDNIPAIDASSTDGVKPENVSGRIQFKDVTFSYPTRKEVEVLQNFNLEIEPGKTVALVGESGCGKSTVVNLIQRFYDPDNGEVVFDGHNIKSLNIKWLRNKIGIVSQEPVLFGCSIAENIKYGRDDVTMEEVIEAAKSANAHKFILQLPKGYETLAGERGTQLSGGQKQRIAIARALVRDPKILLLDEATSALDSESEGLVQAALDQASQGRTTLIIAHRLSTVKNAEVIYAIDNGKVMEKGNHEELMANKGIYYQLVTLQTFDNGQTEDNEEMEIDLKDVALVEKTRKRTISRSLSVDDTKKDKEEKEEDVDIPTFMRVFRLNFPEWYLILIGFLGSVIAGSLMPVFAILFSEMLKVFTETGDELKNGAFFWSMMFLVLGILSGLGNYLTTFCFGLSGERLTMRLRYMSFQSLLRQDMAYFDETRHSTGALTTRLATDASLVKNATGIRVNVVLQALVGIVAGLVIGFIYGWKLTLLLIAAVPLMSLAGYAQMRAMGVDQKKDSKLLEEAGEIATESIENVRTVQGLTLEVRMYGYYQDKLLIPYKKNLRGAFLGGFSYAFSQAIVFFIYGGAFRFGAYLVEMGDMEPTNVYKVFFAVAFAGLSVGQASSMLPDYSKAKLAAGMIIKVLDTQPKIDNTSEDGATMDKIHGEVTYKDVCFKYPTRPDVTVLDKVSFQVKSGQTMALVGTSGCGKSTIVSLLQRLYDVADGSILVDGVDIRSLNTQFLRSRIAVVSQEPVLFDKTIAENITYGLEPPWTQDMIENAATMSNAHDFITALPEGYETMVGEKGTQLSGGQKQRVAIARALICNPPILILDEATSALDTENERIVQTALDRAKEGRTCIVIAHRLSTVQGADVIAVIDHGRVVELGTHQELLAVKGAYYSLTSGQLELR